MKILVTGGLGFIGSNFILNILSKNKNISIINLDDKLFGSNSLSLKKIENSENYEFVKGNITDNQLISKLVEKCDSVINFAAESHVDRSISNAKPFIDSNIYGVFTILEAIKKFGKKLVHISTDEVFGSLEKESADENYRFNPSSPYSASKASAELLINSFFVTYDCDCMITRCTNNYGPRQFLEKLIPKAIFYSNNNKKIPIYGTGNNIRDWIHVDDHCEAIFKVLQNGKKGSAYNISSDNEIDNITIIKKILTIMKKPVEMIEYVNDRPGHDFRYSMNSLKIRKELGWSPKISFEKGLKNTINWYLENEKWWKNVSQESLVPEWQKKN
jgi:dTDP-glucose 4,6-dehydratase